MEVSYPLSSYVCKLVHIICSLMSVCIFITAAHSISILTQLQPSRFKRDGFHFNLSFNILRVPCRKQIKCHCNIDGLSDMFCPILIINHGHKSMYSYNAESLICSLRPIGLSSVFKEKCLWKSCDHAMCMKMISFLFSLSCTSTSCYVRMISWWDNHALSVQQYMNTTKIFGINFWNAELVASPLGMSSDVSHACAENSSTARENTYPNGV